jgi:predicted RNA-binding protein YlxR (DUF448 family)
MKRDQKAAMLRIAVVNGKVEADSEGRATGRGAYLHRTNECALKFVNSRIKEFRSLRRRIERGDRIAIAEVVRHGLDRNLEDE